MVKASKIITSYEIDVYLMPEGRRLFSTVGSLEDAREWGKAFAVSLNPPEWAKKEAQSYNGARITKFVEYETALRIMTMAGYRCEDIGGPSPSVRDHINVLQNDGINFTYIRYDGPDTFVHEIICLRPGQKATIHSKGSELRGDSMGCHTVWDETVEYKNVNGEIVRTRLSGGSDIDCPGAKNRLEHLPSTRISDVRDLYPL